MKTAQKTGQAVTRNTIQAKNKDGIHPNPGLPEKKTFVISPKTLNFILMAVIAVVFWGTYFSVFDPKLDLNGDNIHYYSLGQSIHAGKGYTNIMSFSESPHTHFPPGYPFFISLIMNFTDSVSAVKFANGLLFFCSVLLLFSIFKKISGKQWLSFTACLLISFHGEIQRWATIMMSEMLYLFLTVLMTWIILNLNPETIFQKENRKKTLIKLGLFTVCFGYIYLVRTMGASYMLAVLLVLAGQTVYYFVKGYKLRSENASWWKNGVAASVVILLLAALSFSSYKLSWDARNRSVGLTKSDYMNDFGGKTGGGKMETTADWTERIKKNFQLYVTEWIPKAVISPNKNVDIEQGTSSSSAWLGGFVLLALILIGALSLKDKYLIVLYMSVTFAVLMIWQEQYSGLRYFLGVIPFVLFCFLEGLTKTVEYLVRKLTKKEPAAFWQYAVCILVPLLLVSNYAQSVNTQHVMAKYKDWTEAVDVIGPAGAEYIAACEWIGKNLPQNAVVASRKPELFYMYSGYRKGQGILRDGKPDEILNYLIKNKVNYIIIDHWYRHAIATIIPLATQYYPYMFKPILQIGGNYEGMPPTYILQFDPNAKPQSNQNEAAADSKK
ncbi:MAG: hypothetical protein QM654_12660 [Dysgonamonadaceae bacterium]